MVMTNFKGRGLSRVTGHDSSTEGYTLSTHEEWEQFAKAREHRSQYWGQLRRARADFELSEDFGKKGLYGFIHYLQENYGLRPELDSQGNFTSECAIIDEKKYLLFLLKYGA